MNRRLQRDAEVFDPSHFLGDQLFGASQSGANRPFGRIHNLPDLGRREALPIGELEYDLELQWHAPQRLEQRTLSARRGDDA